jgi:dihydrolipoamide dehydrogenase
MKQADVVVIGGGPGGYVCAIRLAQLGRTVTVIEAENVGGVCLNVGCIPSKAMITAAGLVDKLHKAADMGITATGLSVDMKKLKEWKDTVVKQLTTGVAGLL